MKTKTAVQILRSAGYQVVQRSVFHIQILDDDSTINIWPTTNKILKQFKPGPAKKFTNLLSAVEEELQPFTYEVIPPTPEMEWIMWWRKNPIKRLGIYVTSL